MSQPRGRRVGLGLLTSIVLVFGIVGQAVAAGPPENLQMWLTELKSSLGNSTFLVKVNPNGAQTTLELEYSEGELGPFTTVKTVNIGSGTSVVSVDARFRGVTPNQVNAFRVTATNAKGSVQTEQGYETIPVVLDFLLGKTYWGKDASYSVSGTWTLNFNGNAIKCNESSHGSFGGVGGVGGEYEAELFNCSVYSWTGAKICDREPISYTLDASLTSEAPLVNIGTLCPGEQGGELSILFKEPFLAETPYSGGVSRPITMTASVGFIGGGSITSSGTMALTGADNANHFTFACEVIW